jgi:hypothetical protein
MSHVVGLHVTRAFGLHADWSEGRLHTGQLQLAEHRFQNGPPAPRVRMLHHSFLTAEHEVRVSGPLIEIVRNRLISGHFVEESIHAFSRSAGGWRAAPETPDLPLLQIGMLPAKGRG